MTCSYSAESPRLSSGSGAGEAGEFFWLRCGDIFSPPWRAWDLVCVCSGGVACCADEKKLAYSSGSLKIKFSRGPGIRFIARCQRAALQKSCCNRLLQLRWASLLAAAFSATAQDDSGQEVDPRTAAGGSPTALPVCGLRPSNGRTSSAGLSAHNAPISSRF